jgi:oligopeptide/dipeptide ABC transporter ATP-binding protein
MVLAGLAPAGSVVTADALRVGRAATVGETGMPTGVVFQDAGRALNPLLRVGTQIAEASRRLRRRDRFDHARRSLQALKVNDPARRARQYPHELSGGTRQRAMIAMALAGEPQLVIADEPTTALDVTVQQATLAMLREAIADAGSALIFISHDIAVIAEVTERVLVMYGGRIVEELAVAALPDGVRHPYTRALLATLADLEHEPGTELPTIAGSPPDPASAADGCAFAPRCPRAVARCTAERPLLESSGAGQRVACWRPCPVPVTAERPEERVAR